MRKRLLCAFIFALALHPVAAWAEGPSGSKENSNQVTCGDGTDTPAGKVYAGMNGIEICSDDNATPDGRIIASPDGYAAADGDNDNGAASGYIRLDQAGPTCNGKSEDSTTGPGDPCG